ncbi:putative receptor-like protein kinase [Quercus suber]|uniref:Receptor-like protein kinase n=1 Tax=Quercus suber TaxID=58331 RepID=A0AAW0L520_QUESU
MTHSSLSYEWVLLIFFYGILLMCMSSCLKSAILGYLYLGVNNLIGNIQAWIGNFSSLYVLGLFENNFQGSIPSDLGHLQGLKFLHLNGNNQSGTIPPQIFNISSVYFFSITQNQLHGSLPPDIGLTLPHLQVFYCGINNFTRPIPASLSNASQLQRLALEKNGLIGPVPRNLASLQGLVGHYLNSNKLGYVKDDDLNFLNFLANCTNLKVLDLGNNYFGGVLPNPIANLSN